ncbi:hypothetical protein ES708_21565 [subsurface metagenome]
MSLLIRGVTNFISLTDTPASYAGQKTKVPQVSEAEDALEFGTPGAKNFLALTDTPASYAGQKTKVPQVNEAENALEFIAAARFTTTKIFDGRTASPPTLYLRGVTRYPNYNPVDSGGRMQRSIAIAIDGNIYVGGGRYFTVDIWNNQWWKYNVAGGAWTRLTDLPANYGFTVNWRSCTGYYNGKIYLRAEYLDNAYNRKLLEYDIAGDSWAVYDTFGDLHSARYVLAACTDALYLAVDTTFKKWDYTTHTWTDLAALGDAPRAGGIIGDEVYAVYDDKTYKYNKVGNTWDDQAHPRPSGYVGFVCGCYIEDMDELWGLSYTTEKVYKYTTAGGWVQQFTYARDSRVWNFMLQLTGEDKIYCYFDNPESYLDYDDLVACGSIHVYDPDSLNWELLGVDLDQGDFMIIDPGGVPVLMEKDGILKLTVSELTTFFITEAGRYRFILSKDYSFTDVNIWRSVWG